MKAEIAAACGSSLYPSDSKRSEIVQNALLGNEQLLTFELCLTGHISLGQVSETWKPKLMVEMMEHVTII